MSGTSWQKVTALKSPATPPALERTSEMIKNLQREIQEHVCRSPPSTSVDANGRKVQTGEPEAVRVRVEEKEERNSFEILGNTVETVVGPWPKLA
jgi:hypothetical protein